MTRRTVGAMVLAFLIPGAGHVFLGRRGKGLAFLAIVGAMFLLGILLHGKVYTFMPGRLLNNLATLGAMGSGILYLGARAFGHTGNVMSATFEHGTAFILTAGVMNLLLVLDTFDISEGRKS